MFLLISLFFITSLNIEYSCSIRVFEYTDESIVMEFICPFSEIDQCKSWFKSRDGTIQECWKYNENYERIPFNFGEWEYRCHIRLFEGTDEPIVMEFLCPYSELETCESWFDSQGGTIIECWKI